MLNYLLLFKRLIPYWRYACLNILFNAVSAIFAIFSLSLVIPFLRILFNPVTETPHFQEFGLNKEALIGNLNYLVYYLGQHYGKPTTLLLLCLVVIILFFFKNLTQYLGLYVLAPIRTGIVKDIRNELYHKLLVLPLSYYSASRRGDLISRTSTDVQEVENAIIRSFELLFREPITIILFLITLISISGRLTLYVFLLLPVAGIIIGLISKALRRKSLLSQRQMGHMMANTEETLGGIRVLKAFNAQSIASMKFGEINEAFSTTMKGVQRRTDLASPLSEMLGVIILAFILILGGSMVLNASGGLAAESFIAYVVIFSQLINPAKNLSTAFYQVQRGAASFERIKQVIEAEEVIIEQKNAIPVKQFSHSILFKNVSFRYENELVLNHINLEIPKQTILALVGPSGAGKSTLVDLLPRFYDVSEGEILVDGVDIRKFAIDDLRGLFGIVTQQPILFNDTVFNNIAFGKKVAHYEEVRHAAGLANAHDFISALPFGYYTRIGDRGSRLSGGQRQRLSIARAVLLDPPILIFDEATSALDTESERLVQDALNRLMTGKTSVIIAHRFSTINKADKIIVIDHGNIVEQGTYQELVSANGLFKKLNDLQLLMKHE